MSAPGLELQKAVFETLAGDAALVAALGGAKIHDLAPADVALPYLTFGQTRVYDWSTATESGSEHLFTLHVWSRAGGRKQALDIMDLVHTRLHDAELVLDAHDLVNLRQEYAETRYEEDLGVHHGIVRFRAAIEIAA